MVIKKLKEKIKSLSGNIKEEKIKKELEEIESINIELDHRVTKLIAENEHLKQTYQQLYDSIKSSRIRSKEQCDDLIKQVNLKSAENFDLNASLQEQVLVITALKDNLRKLKEKDVVDEAVISHPIDPEMLKVDVAPLAPKLQNNRTIHSDYLKHTQKETATLREIVKHERSLKSLNTSLDYALGNACPLTRITTTAKVPLRKPISLESNPPKPVVILVYSQKPKESRNNILASKTKSWLWHRRLSHLNFRAINHLARQGLVRGLSKLKFEKDHLCSACAMGKSKKKSHKPKYEDTNQEKLYLLHMDLCGLMHVKSVNRKKYILVIVDDYSRFTWVKCLRSKDEAPDFIIKFLKMIQVGISHETSVAHSPQQNGVVERRNRTLIEAACTMLIYARAPLFLWAEEVVTACFTQNCSIIRLRRSKTPYELLHNKLPDLSYFYVFGALCSGPALHEMNPTIINSGLVPKPTSSTPFVPPSRINLDLLFQPLFDELLTPPPSVDQPAPEVIASIAEVVAPEPAESTGSPSSTTVGQVAPSPSKTQTTHET
nr:retrovirus-related Pol polyprotein from transposon TNT 1-94 [Tanacetum cinerariifolium]